MPTNTEPGSFFGESHAQELESALAGGPVGLRVPHGLLGTLATQQDPQVAGLRRVFVFTTCGLPCALTWHGVVVVGLVPERWGG